MESTGHSTSAQSAPAQRAHDHAAPENSERAQDDVSNGHLVQFLSATERAVFRENLDAETLVVEVDTSTLARGQLSEAIETAIESALAAPRGLGVSETIDRTSADRTLGDQLFRARCEGKKKIALFLSTLEPLLTPMRVLESVDAAILRFYAFATKTRPLRLVLQAGDESLGAYTDPVPLHQALAIPPPGAHRAALPHQPMAAETAPTATAELDAVIVSPVTAPASALPSHRYIPLPRSAPDAPDDDEQEDAVTTIPPRVYTPPASAAAAAETAPQKSDPPEANYQERLRDLARVRGPQPLTGLETAFVTSYVPLSFGIATGRVRREDSLPYFEFREGFERAYREAYPTLGSRTRRPKMVFDAPALAQAKARSHSARAAQLLVVDALRFDMGVRLARRLAETAGTSASLAGREVLWALLPTTTERQMVGLVRGPSALSSAASIDASTESMRGRSAEVVRRIRFGARDLHRLDCVAADIADMEANPRENAEQVYEELKTSVDRCATIISAYIATLPSRTLLYVLGDHGFTVTHDGRVHQGGGSPEEVMVPALAYFIASPH